VSDRDGEVRAICAVLYRKHCLFTDVGLLYGLARLERASQDVLTNGPLKGDGQVHLGPIASLCDSSECFLLLTGFPFPLNQIKDSCDGRRDQHRPVQYGVQDVFGVQSSVDLQVKLLQCDPLSQSFIDKPVHRSV
jgi:hypothetical protein